MRTAGSILLLAALLSTATAVAEQMHAAQVVESYLEARGGADRWRELRSLELTGTYAAFSFYEPFRLVRKHGDRYRLDYVVLGSPATRARDAEGPWGQHPLLRPQAARITEEPYRSQLERESLFGLPLLDHESRGIVVELLGGGEVEGQPTVDLKLIFADGKEEIWHLDAESWLEVAVDAQIFDHTQGTDPMRRRTFYDDFREVEGLVLPFQVDHEFGARLEAMTVESVRLDAEIADEEFEPPPPAASQPGEQDGAPAEEAARGAGL